MKKAITLVLFSIGIICFALFVFFVCYRIFNKEDEMVVGTADISLKDDGTGVNIEKLYPMSESEAKGLKPYEFQIVNAGTIGSKYQLLLEEEKIIDDERYKNMELLSRSQLKYELTFEGKVIKVGMLSDIVSNVLETREIEKKQTHNYSIKVWLPADKQNTDWRNKYYHYKINVQPLEEEES